MSLPTQTISQSAKGLARLEMEKTAHDNLVYIESISPDQTRAIVRPVNTVQITSTYLQVKILNAPGIYTPIDASNYMGLLKGNPKSPLGIELIPKTSPQPLISHAIPNQVFGQGNTKPVSVDGKIPMQTTNFSQQLNAPQWPDNRGTVIKPPARVPRETSPQNTMILADPTPYLDNQSAFLYVDEDEAKIVADPQNGIIASKRTGVSIGGQLNINSSLQDIRLQGAWRFNPMHQFMIPSTAVSPQPILIFDPPALQLTQGLDTYIANIMNS